MSAPRVPRDARHRRRRLEMLIFLLVSVAGVYALGHGLRGLFERGAGIDLGWLAVAGGACWVLYAQMCRVHARWPHRPRPAPRPRGGAVRKAGTNGDDPNGSVT